MFHYLMDFDTPKHIIRKSIKPDGYMHRTRHRDVTRKRNTSHIKTNSSTREKKTTSFALEGVLSPSQRRFIDELDDETLQAYVNKGDIAATEGNNGKSAAYHNHVIATIHKVYGTTFKDTESEKSAQENKDIIRTNGIADGRRSRRTHNRRMV